MAERSIRELVSIEALRQGVDPALALAVARTESAYDQGAVSPKGARGVMQLMPGTAKDLGVNPDILEENIHGGVKYLKQMQGLFPGDKAKQLAAYNAGPGAVQEYGGVPPYKETKGYVSKILGMLGPREAAAATATRAPSRGLDLSEEIYGKTLPGLDLSEEIYGGAPVAPTVSSTSSRGVAPLPPTPADVRNPLAPDMPDDVTPLQQREAEQLMAHESTLQGGTSAARSRPTLGSSQVMLPGQTGIPEARSTRNPLQPTVPPPAQALTPELISQGYGTAEDARQAGQLLPWLKARAGKPEVWRQAMDTGARLLTGYATSGLSLPAQAGAQMATEAFTQVAGLQPPSARRIVEAGAMETAGNMAAPLALKVFQGAMRMTRGAKQLVHDQRLAEVQQAARIAREPLEHAQAEGKALGTESSLQSRELRAIRPGFIRGMEQQLKDKSAALEDMAARTQSAVRGQLGGLGADQAELLMRRVGQFGPEVSDAAVSAAYKQLDDVKRLSVNSRAIHEAMRGIHPAVRDGMKEALSVIPGEHTMMSFAQLRGIQTSVGKNIRSLERSIARNMDDMNGPVRLDALKRLYASTFQALDDTMASKKALVWKATLDGPDELVSVRFPADTKTILEEANTLNRVVSMMDRVETLWGTKAISTVGGQEIFDADKLLRAIKGDAFLVRMLQQHDLYDGLHATLGKIAATQKTKFQPEGVSVVGLQGLNQQLARAEALRDVSRTRAQEGLQAVTHQRLGEADYRLRAGEARIDATTPAQQSASLTGDIARPLIAGMGIAGATGRAGTGIGAGVAVASIEGIGRYLLSRHGQRFLEQLFARDPLLTMPKVGFLLNAAAAREPQATGAQ